MGDRPIIFSAPMVRALLDGRKTQTRRVLKPQPKMLRGAGPFYRPHPTTAPHEWHALHGGHIAAIVKVPYAVGDRLWVREAWFDPQMDGARRLYVADNPQDVGPVHRKRPSIHMPRWASRLTLTVTDVRVQRLQEISEEDARAEGLEWAAPTWGVKGLAESWNGDPRLAFAALWNSLHGPGAWDANPWVCALTFTVDRRNIDAKEG